MSEHATIEKPAPPVRVLPARQRSRGGRRGDTRLAVWLMLPAAVVLMVVGGYPVVRAVYLSFFSDGISGSYFIGLRNYTDALFGYPSSEFWAAFWNTVFFTVVTVTFEIVLGFLMALIMNRAFRRGRGLIRASILVPWAIPTAVTAVLWRWIFQAGGIANSLTHSNVLWLGQEWPAKWAIVLGDTWKNAPFVGLLILAGLQIIPGDLYEAASIDGAGVFKRFRAITLPLVKPALLVATLFRLLDVLRIFDLPQIFTGGANNTTTLSMLAYRSSIGDLKYGYGSALSTLTFIFIFVVALFFVKVLGANVVQTQQPKVANR